jgi:hypothetical protein
MVLPTNLTTLASNSEANRLYHQEIDAALPWLSLPTTIPGGTSGHVAHHDALHDAIDRGLRKTIVPNVTTGHGVDHNVIHAYVNTSYQNEYHVTKTGNDGNAGTWASPKLTIGSAMTAALAANASGQTARIRVHATTPGTTTVYREAVTIGSGGTTSAMVLEAAEDGVVISGADDWTGGWTTHDAPNRIYYKTWTNNWGVQAWPPAWEAQSGGWTDIIRRREIVVIDGTWVRQVLTLAEIDDYDAAYYVDEAADRLYVRIPTGGNISTIPIEVAIRDRCLHATSRTNLTLRGLVFQHAATPMQSGQVRLDSCTNPLLEDVTSRGSSWSGLTVGGSGLTSKRCHFDDNGVMGYTGFQVADQLYEDGTCNRNNTFRGAWANYRNWEDGCKIIFSSRITFRRFDWYDNNAPGCWFDSDNKDILLEDCRSKGNLGAGAYFFEATQGPVTLRRCKANENFRGLSTTSVRNLTMDDCDFWDNHFEAQLGYFPGNPTQEVTEWDTGLVKSVAPGNWALQNNLLWASNAGDQYLVSGWGMSDTLWDGWKNSLTASGNAYHSQTSSQPYFVRNGTGNPVTVNFTDWKANLGGGRDSTSTFSSSAPSPAPSL